MFPILSLCVLAFSQNPKTPDDDWYMGFETIDPKLKVDWAQRYVSTSGKVDFAIRLHGDGRGYSISGFCRTRGEVPEPLSGTFTQRFGQMHGPIRIHTKHQSWRGAWNRRRGCFELRPGGSPERLQLWQQLTPMAYGFLGGRKPLAPPSDVPDHLMGIETESETLYGFRANFHHVAELATRELVKARWKKSFFRSWWDKPAVVFSCFYEPGPTGRSVVIEPETSVPESHPASDLIMAGTRKKGWVGVVISGPKFHG